MFEHPKHTALEEEDRPVDIKVVASGKASFPYTVNIALIQPPPWGRNATGNVDLMILMLPVISPVCVCVSSSNVSVYCVATCELF